jgi:hypothetical protein
VRFLAAGWCHTAAVKWFTSDKPVARTQHAVDKALYALRNRIERFFNRVAI